MGRRNGHLLGALAVLLGLGFSTSAGALPVEVKYSFTGTSTLSNGLVTNLDGMATFRFQGDAGGNVVSGPATLLTSTNTGMAAVTFGGLTILKVFVHQAVLLTPLSGSLTAGNKLVLSGGMIGQTGTLHCWAAACPPGAISGSFPNPIPTLIPFGKLTFNYASLTGMGTGTTGMGPPPPTGTGDTFVTSLSYTEVSRTVVIPEPSSTTLWWLGLAVVGYFVPRLRKR